MLREVKDRNEDDEETDAEDGERAAMPLAFNQHGDPVEVPEEAVGWRVRRHKIGDRGGAPELVYENARPLVLELEASADDLIERVGSKPGRYRLDPVDALGRPIRGAGPAYALVEKVNAPAVAESRGPDEVTTRLLSAVEQLVKSQSESNAALTSQMAQVISAMSNAVVPPDKRRPVEFVQTVAVPEAQQRAGGFDWDTFMSTMAPALQGVIGTLMQRLVAGPPAASVAQAHGG